MFIGKHAFNKGLYNHAVEWFLTALSLARSGSDASAPLSEIEPFLKTAIRVVSYMKLYYTNISKSKLFQSMMIYFLKKARLARAGERKKSLTILNA